MFKGYRNPLSSEHFNIIETFEGDGILTPKENLMCLLHLYRLHTSGFGNKLHFSSHMSKIFIVSP
jgi:hypothetical protein